MVGIFFYLYIYIFFLHYNTTTHFYTRYTNYTSAQIVLLLLPVSLASHCFPTHLLRKSEPLFVSLTRLILCFATEALNVLFFVFISLASPSFLLHFSPSFLQVSLLALLGQVSLFELWQFLIANFNFNLRSPIWHSIITIVPTTST